MSPEVIHEPKEYDAAWAEWLADMTPEEREELKAMGLDRPSRELPTKAAKNHDAADLPIAETHQTASVVEDSRCEVVRIMLSFILDSKNRSLTVECMAAACGVASESLTPSAIAKRHALSRASVDARMVAICDELKLPPSSVMRSIEARRIAKNARNKSVQRN